MLRCAVSGGEERSSEVDWQKERGGDKEQPACPHLETLIDIRLQYKI